LGLYAHFSRNFISQATELSVDLLGTFKGSRDMGDDVFDSDVFDKLRLCEKTLRLFPCPAQYQSPATFLKPVRQFFKGVQPRPIERGHISEPQNHYGIESIEIGGGLLEFVSGPE
jgi:hypothetical protein